MPKAPPGCVAIGTTSVGTCHFTNTGAAGYMEVDAAAGEWQVFVNGALCTQGVQGESASFPCVVYSGQGVIVDVRVGIVSARVVPG